MKMADERELNKIWDILSNHGKSLADHCTRITTIEQDHKHRDQSKHNNLTYLLAGLVVVETALLVWGHLV